MSWLFYPLPKRSLARTRYVTIREGANVPRAHVPDLSIPSLFVVPGPSHPLSHSPGVPTGLEDRLGGYPGPEQLSIRRQGVSLKRASLEVKIRSDMTHRALGQSTPGPTAAQAARSHPAGPPEGTTAQEMNSATVHASADTTTSGATLEHLESSHAQSPGKRSSQPGKTKVLSASPDGHLL